MNDDLVQWLGFGLAIMLMIPLYPKLGKIEQWLDSKNISPTIFGISLMIAPLILLKLAELSNIDDVGVLFLGLLIFSALFGATFLKSTYFGFNRDKKNEDQIE